MILTSLRNKLYKTKNNIANKKKVYKITAQNVVSKAQMNAQRELNPHIVSLIIVIIFKTLISLTYLYFFQQKKTKQKRIIKEQPAVSVS
jgi:nitroimidazol reductase NimA-like FMN-containing flavoprotein (pyridoxamine 5'-phosphate oxidase superfamily)